jgi:hypothetical protein
MSTKRPVSEDIRDKVTIIKYNIAISYLCICIIILCGYIINEYIVRISPVILIVMVCAVMLNLFCNVLRCPKCHKLFRSPFALFTYYIPDVCPHCGEQLK